MIKITLIINGQNELVRIITNEKCVCQGITKLVNHFEQMKKDLQMDEQIKRIVIDCDMKTKKMPSLMPYVTNMCGKLTHTSTNNIYNDNILPYVKIKQNQFGNFKSVSTQNCNFHTGSSLTTSLFRAGNNTEKILHSIKHVFVKDFIVDTNVHNIVCSFRLGYPISSKNNMLLLRLKTLKIANVLKCIDTDDRMYLHAFILSDFDKNWLQSIDLQSYELGLFRLENLRINICRTGVVNLFMSLPIGFKLQDYPDQLVLPFCNFFFNIVQSCT